MMGVRIFCEVARLRGLCGGLQTQFSPWQSGQRADRKKGKESEIMPSEGQERERAGCLGNEQKDGTM